MERLQPATITTITTPPATKTILSAMDGVEYAAFLQESVPAFAREKVTSGAWDQASALELARLEFEKLLPQGLATPDNYLYTMRDPLTQAAVGMLWFAAQIKAGKKIAYVYDVSVKPAHQRQGHALRAFTALEAEVAALGLAGIALHVFGHNNGAHALYVKLGYDATNINMFKQIGNADA